MFTPFHSPVLSSKGSTVYTRLAAHLIDPIHDPFLLPARGSRSCDGITPVGDSCDVSLD